MFFHISQNFDLISKTFILGLQNLNHVTIETLAEGKHSLSEPGRVKLNQTFLKIRCSLKQQTARL